MTTPVQQMLEKYNCKNTSEYKNKMRYLVNTKFLQV